MEKEGITKYKINNDYEFIDDIKNNLNNIILVGRSGTGKTNFLNKICNTNFELRKGYIIEDYNHQKKVQYSYTVKGDNFLIEFPGIDQNSFKTLITLKDIISHISVRMICIFVTYESRFELFLENIYFIMKIFWTYKDNIAIIMTHFDEFTERIGPEGNKPSKEEIEYKIQNIKNFILEKFRISNILLTELKSDFNEIYKNLQIIEKKMINIPRLMIANRFLLSSLLYSNRHNFELYIEKENLKEEFEESLDIFKKELFKTEDNDLKRALYFALKSYKESLIEKYTDIIKNKTEYSDEIINNLIIFNNSIFESFNIFKRMIEGEINIKIGYDNNKNCSEFRRCPHCGLIWMQTQGCNDVFCGERNGTKDIIRGIYKNYIVKYENKKIIINHEEINNENKFRGNGPRIIGGLKEEEEEKNISLRKNGKQEIKALGCGAALKWDEMEDMTKFVLDSLKEKPVSDYDSDVLKIAEKIYGDEF